MKKNEILDIVIEDIRFPNTGIVQVGERLLEVKGALPGQRLSVRVIKKGKTNRAVAQEVISPAPEQIALACSQFGTCGGCAFLHIPYEYELELKTKMVKDLFADFNMEEKFLPSVGSPENGYRNKMEYSFGDDGNENGILMLGMRKKGSFYEAIDASGCLLVHADFGKILTATVEYFRGVGEHFYHRRKAVGTLRHLTVRHGRASNEILVNLVTTGGNNYAEYADALLRLPLENEIVGVLNTTTNSIADAIIPDEVKLLHGRDYYFETLSNISYKVPAFAFYQTNSKMVETLYNTIADMAGEIENKTIFDLYCGAGTIGKFLAKKGAKRVVGVEIVPEAVASAMEDAPPNCEFIAGDVKQIVKELKESPDVIILDPPREGIVPKAIPNILAFDAKKIVYVSCKPTSFVQNLQAFLDGGYSVENIVCVDMFPRTANVEVVCSMVKNEHPQIEQV